MSQFIEYPVLYKYTTTGAIQQWQICVKDNTYYTVEGQKDGKLTTSLPTVCHGKNIGKKNETSNEEQAVLEALAKMQKKRDKGYNEILLEEKLFFEPMLAFEVDKYKKLLFTVRTFVQPKLDGLRCVNENNSLTSRNGKPYLACPHLYQNEVILDGELYNHKFKDDFNKIVSLCKKINPTEEELIESRDNVEFWAYDYPSFEGVFSERYAALTKWSLNCENIGIRLVPTFEVKSWEDIEKYHEKFLSNGFEGSIIRLDLGNYENKRSKQLLKYKNFVDEEFLIVGAVEGEGGRTGTIGKFIMQLDSDPERTFGSNVKGDFKYLTEVWNDRDKYIGTKATVKYFARTPDNVPRFPYITKLNREEYE